MVDKIPVRLVVDRSMGQPGEMVTVTFSVEGSACIRSLALTNIAFADDRLELLSGCWLVDGLFADWDGETLSAALAFEENVILSGQIFALTFRIREEVEVGTLPITCEVVAKAVFGNKEFAVPVSAVCGSVDIGIEGDFTGDGAKGSEDALYLLYHTLLPEKYPIYQNGDINQDGVTDSGDAIYLLYHILLPEQYPLV